MVNDLVGKKFFRLTVLKREGLSKNRKATWLCKCDCGVELVVIGGNMLSGGSKSCGCYNTEQKTKHGDHKTPFYAVWRDLRYRCNCESSPEYKNYDGRGIKVCPEWEDYLQFKADMFESFRSGLTIDRVDVNKGYSKENCKWSTIKEQNNNMRRNVFLDSPWGRLTVAQVAEKMGVKGSLLRSRLRKNWSTEMLYSPSQSKRKCS